MKSARRSGSAMEMRNEYDFSGGVRGKYARRYAEGSNVVVLDPDVAKVFSDAESVNRTLRAVAQIMDLRPRKLRGAKPGRDLQLTRKARG